MFCHNCGKEVLEDAKFCAHCGTTVNGAVNVSSAPVVESSSFMLPSIAACGLIGLIAGIMHYYTGSYQKHFDEALIFEGVPFGFVGVLIGTCIGVILNSSRK